MNASNILPTEQNYTNKFTIKSFYAYVAQLSFLEVCASLASLKSTFMDLTKGKFEVNFKKLIGIISKTVHEEKNETSCIVIDINKKNEAFLIQIILEVFKDEISTIKRFATLIFLLDQFPHKTEQNVYLVDAMKSCVSNIDQLNATLKYMPKFIFDTTNNRYDYPNLFLLARFNTYWAPIPASVNAAAEPQPNVLVSMWSRLYSLFKSDSPPKPSAPPLDEKELKKLYESRPQSP